MCVDEAGSNSGGLQLLSMNQTSIRIPILSQSRCVHTNREVHCRKLILFTCCHCFFLAVNYLQFSNAGISLYGFSLDRSFLYAAFGIQVTLTLFVL